MITMNDYCQKVFGEKLYKISLNGGMTCPNRDGTCGTRGCIFCSEGGSGDFAESTALSIQEQIERGKLRVKNKFHGKRYIAYFQAFTNTYAPVEYLRNLYMPVIERDDIAVLSIATRPDCLSAEILELLDEMNQMKPIWVELGLQTMHNSTAQFIRRGYPLEMYDQAVKALNQIGIHTITHVILGLPGETNQDMIDTVKHVVQVGSQGIKLQLLHILKGTDLEPLYEAEKINAMTQEEYIDVLMLCLKQLPKDMVVHRLTGDGPKKLLIAPLWTWEKKKVMNEIRKAMIENGLA